MCLNILHSVTYFGFIFLQLLIVKIRSKNKKERKKNPEKSPWNKTAYIWNIYKTLVKFNTRNNICNWIFYPNKALEERFQHKEDRCPYWHQGLLLKWIRNNRDAGNLHRNSKGKTVSPVSIQWHIFKLETLVLV